MYLRWTNLSMVSILYFQKQMSLRECSRCQLSCQNTIRTPHVVAISDYHSLSPNSASLDTLSFLEHRKTEGFVLRLSEWC